MVDRPASVVAVVLGELLPALGRLDGPERVGLGGLLRSLSAEDDGDGEAARGLKEPLRAL